MGSTNKVMEAKNRKVRMYDMEHNNYVNNGVVSLEYKYHERTVAKDGSSLRQKYRNRELWRKYSWLLAVGGC